MPRPSRPVLTRLRRRLPLDRLSDLQAEASARPRRQLARSSASPSTGRVAECRLVMGAVGRLPPAIRAARANVADTLRAL